MIISAYETLLNVYRTEQAIYRPIALTSQILRVSSRCSLTISVLVQQPHTAQKLTILIQNYYKVLQNLLSLIFTNFHKQNYYIFYRHANIQRT
jgi:hypothetical protein